MNNQIRMSMEKHGVIGASLAVVKQEDVKLYHLGKQTSTQEKLVHDETLFNACSMSKFVTAFLVLTLASQDKISLDEDVSELVKGSGIPMQSRVRFLSLRDLLRHQAGVIDADNSFMPLTEVGEIPKLQNLLSGEGAPTQFDATKVGQFIYSDGSYCFIEYILEQKLQQPFKHLVENYLFKPLKMSRSTYDWKALEKQSNCTRGHTKEGRAHPFAETIYPYAAASGLWTTAEDLSKLLREWYQISQGKGQLGLLKNDITNLVTGSNEHPYAGLGLFIENVQNGLEITSLGWGVGFQSMLAYQPNSGTGLLILTNTDLGKHQLKGFIGDVYKQLLG